MIIKMKADTLATMTMILILSTTKIANAIAKNAYAMMNLVKTATVIANAIIVIALNQISPVANKIT